MRIRTRKERGDWKELEWSESEKKIGKELSNEGKESGRRKGKRERTEGTTGKFNCNESNGSFMKFEALPVSVESSGSAVQKVWPQFNNQ